LGPFVSSAQEQEDCFTDLAVINPVARTVIDLQFPHATLERATLTEVPVFQPVQAGENMRMRLPIPQTMQPHREWLSPILSLVAQQLEHVKSVCDLKITRSSIASASIRTNHGGVRSAGTGFCFLIDYGRQALQEVAEHRLRTLRRQTTVLRNARNPQRVANGHLRLGKNFPASILLAPFHALSNGR